MQKIDQLFKEHIIFTQILGYAEFYKSLSFSVFGFITQGTNAMINVDSYVYSSIQGTLESINDILIKGRINDAYALLRKYYDSTIINVYTNLYLKDNFSVENFVVEKIDNWIKGKEKLPEYRIMTQYIKDSEELAVINDLLFRDKTYKSIRKRCNDHTHYNFYHNMLYNDNEIYLSNRLKFLDLFSKDLVDIFTLHFSYVFSLNEHYMMSSDYVDSLDCGITPEKDSQYWVAPFVQKMYENVIKKNRADLAQEIKSKTSMKIE